jgi:hypothetical protein
MTVTNTGAQPISAPISVVLTNLPPNITLVNATGTQGGSPYIRIMNSGSLAPGQAVAIQLRFTNPSNTVITFTPITDSGL